MRLMYYPNSKNEAAGNISYETKWLFSPLLSFTSLFLSSFYMFVLFKGHTCSVDTLSGGPILSLA